MSSNKTIYKAMDDPMWQNPYIDQEEEQTRILLDGTKLTYHYVHGGFTDTGVKFLFCMPPKENYKGRFFQYLSPFPGPDEEIASLSLSGEDDRIAFALSHGAYYVESNMGSLSAFGGGTDPALTWKSSAAAAEYSRKWAMEFYGTGRPYGYVHGGSGGGYKTMACIENTNAWDGGLPFVIGSPYSLPNSISLHVQGQRALRRVFGKIVDALDAGGSGNMYEGLNKDEAAMLKEITAMGFPPMVWYPEAWGMKDPGSLPVLAPSVKMADPQYFIDFWTKPGYLGSDEKSSAYSDRLVFSTRVSAVHLDTQEENRNCESGNDVDGAWKKQAVDGERYWLEVEKLPEGDDLYLEGVNLRFESGALKGRELAMGKMVRRQNQEGGCLTLGMCVNIEDLEGLLLQVQPGDELTMDNSDYIALQSYYRHQVPDDKLAHAWDQFRDQEGKPAIPQRRDVFGIGFNGTGTTQDGDIQCKAITIQCLMDESTFPWCADWYREKIKEAKGSDEDYRLYYMERCMHGNVSSLRNQMVTNYIGALNQAMLDLSDWVERGIEPLETTVYQNVDNQIIPAESALERKGIQPVVNLLANGEACAKVKAGEMVIFTADAQCPPGAGKITALDFELSNKMVISQNGDGQEAFKTKGNVRPYEKDGLNCATAEVCFRYDVPGTYFAAVEVCANRSGDAQDPFTQVRNLARARVIVE